MFSFCNRGEIQSIFLLRRKVFDIDQNDFGLFLLKLLFFNPNWEVRPSILEPSYIDMY